jgi:putative sterol carrier protein
VIDGANDAATSSLTEALEHFAARVNGDARLRKMIADWERTIALEAAEGGGGGLRVEGGGVRVTALPAEADIRLVARAAVLEDVFRGTLSPTEPYVDGSLRVEGSQEDVLRLDFLSLMIWGE